jgi:uncharacterized protein
LRLLVLTQPGDSHGMAEVLGVLRSAGLEIREHTITSQWHRSLPAEMEEVENLLVSYRKEQEQEDWLLFALGWMRGRRAPGMLFRLSSVPDHPLQGDLPAASGVEEVKSYFLRENRLWEERCRIENAERTLEEKDYYFNKDAFAFAVSRGDVAAVELFLQGALSPDSQDASGTPVLCLAARNRHFRLVEILVEAGADLNGVSRDRGSTALMDAAARGDQEICGLLINAGAKIDTVGKDGQTALMLAVGAKSEEVSGLLLGAGADPYHRDKLGMTAHGYAKLFRLEEFLRLCEEVSKDEE